LRLTIVTALTLTPPRWKSELERRLVEPLGRRICGGYPELLYAHAREQRHSCLRAAFAEFAGEQKSAGLEDRFAEEDTRRDRCIRIMTAVEILICPPRAFGDEFAFAAAHDPVDEEERRPVRDEVGDGGHERLIFL
jgi:hypothetical protein